MAKRKRSSTHPRAKHKRHKKSLHEKRKRPLTSESQPPSTWLNRTRLSLTSVPTFTGSQTGRVSVDGAPS
jgi:hypothetical protein